MITFSVIADSVKTSVHPQIQEMNISLSRSFFRSYTYETPSMYKNINYKSAPVKSTQEPQTPPKSSRLIPLWVQIAFFLALAIFIYVVFASMETNSSFPGLE